MERICSSGHTVIVMNITSSTQKLKELTAKTVSTLGCLFLSNVTKESGKDFSRRKSRLLRGGFLLIRGITYYEGLIPTKSQESNNTKSTFMEQKF